MSRGGHIVFRLLCLGLVLTLSSFKASAKELKGTGAQPMNKGELKALFQRGETIQGSFYGPDLVALMVDHPDLALHVKRAKILCGLDFSRIRPVSVENFLSQKDWSEEEKSRWLKDLQSRGLTALRLLRNRITIEESVLFAPEWRDRLEDPHCPEFFEDALKAEGVFFDKEFTLKSLTFRGNANFNLAVFEGKAHFSRSRFEGEVSFSNALFEMSAEFEAVLFKQGAYFAGSAFSGDALFRESVSLSEMSSFEEASFSGEAHYERVWFDQGADFSKATFKKNAAFLSAGFWRSALFEGAVFEGPVHFDDARFALGACPQAEVPEGISSFAEAKFRSEAHFDRAVLCKGSFISARFEKLASFLSAEFRHEAHFEKARFADLAYFRAADFLSTLRLEENRFEGYVDFRSAHIEKLFLGHREIPELIHQRLDFRGSEICEGYFRNLIFLEDVDLSYAVMGSRKDLEKRHRPCFLRNAPIVFYSLTFEGEASFVGSRFRGQTLFDKIRFKEHARFLRARFFRPEDSSPPYPPSLFLLSNISFSRLSLSWRQLPRLSSWIKDKDEKAFEEGDLKDLRADSEVELGKNIEQTSDVLAKLETQFRRNNQLQDANSAFYWLKEEERLKDRGWGRSLFFLGRLFFGYGTDLPAMLIASLLVHIPFAWVYWRFGEFYRRSSKELEGESLFSLKLPVLPGSYLAEASQERGQTRDKIHRWKPWHAFLLSVLLLLKVGYRNMRISDKSRADGSGAASIIKWTVRCECVFGYFWLMAALYTLRNTVPVLKTLLSL